jgi:hypothetical protein
MALLSKVLGGESESAVKAAYIYNFMTLIKWPATAYGSQSSPVIVGLVDRDPVSNGIANTLEGQKVGNRPISVRHLRQDDAVGLKECHVIFLGGEGSPVSLATAVKGQPVLLVGDAAGFATNGGTVGFVMKNKKIKLEINREAARQAQLVIPADLLSISTVVR